MVVTMCAVYHGKMREDALVVVNASIGNYPSLRGGWKKMANEKRLTWKRSLDGCEDVGLCEGVTIAEAICKLADLEERGAVEVVHGRWEWFEEWNPSTPDHPRECEDCGWRCSKCKTALEDVVGGYWDNIDEEPKLNYCPNCGAKMDGDGNG